MIRIARSLVLAFALCGSFVAGAQVSVPPLAAGLIDQTATLTTDQKAALEQTLQTFEARKGSQIAVLVVPTTEPESIEQYALRVAEQWKLGRKDVYDGALQLVAKKTTGRCVSRGYGLEGALNDATSKRIVAKVITPRFKQGNFFGGIASGVDRMISASTKSPCPGPRDSLEVATAAAIRLS